MSSQSIGELARSRSLDYARSPRKKKIAILDEFVAATGVGRKTAITLLRDPPPVTPPSERQAQRALRRRCSSCIGTALGSFGPYMLQAAGPRPSGHHRQDGGS